jgi:hypothetical protein
MRLEFQVNRHRFTIDTRRFVNSKNPSLPGGKKGFWIMKNTTLLFLDELHGLSFCSANEVDARCVSRNVDGGFTRKLYFLDYCTRCSCNHRFCCFIYCDLKGA